MAKRNESSEENFFEEIIDKELAARVESLSLPVEESDSVSSVFFAEQIKCKKTFLGNSQQEDDANNRSTDSSESDGSYSSGENYRHLQQNGFMPFFNERNLSHSPVLTPYKKRISDLIELVCAEEMQHLDDMIEAFSGEEESLIELLEERLNESTINTE